MEAPDLPLNESERIAALHGLDILDTPFEERFDRLTRITQNLFKVPIALISLVDEERQWFKSRQGLTACQTSRDVSFCGHTILGRDVMWIEDARKDSRFADNPIVTGEPRVIFYAGYPLRDVDGYHVGTLCVIDHEPRASTPEAIQLLVDMGTEVERELAMIQVGVNLEELHHRREMRRSRLDTVTGTWNRSGILELLKRGLPSCAELDLPATALVAEVQGIPLARGEEEEGQRDSILMEAAAVLRGCILPHDSIGRIDDHRFLLFLAGLSADEVASRVGEVEASLASDSTLKSLGIRVAFGAASTDDPEPQADPEKLLAIAIANLDESSRSMMV